VAFDLSLTGIPRGTHQAQVDLVAAGKAVASGTVTFTRKDDGPALQASGVKGPVTLRQTRPSAASISSWYYVTGIPIPRGRLTDPASARLTDARGKEIPAHFEPLCHWSPKKEDIKWLRVAFCAPVVAGESPEYSLEFGPGVRSTPHPAPVRVTETPEQVTVDTGACRFVVPRSTGGFLRAVTQGEKELYRAPATDGPYVVDHTGAVFRAALDRAPELVVEEANPVRTVIRTEAWHVKEGSGHSPAGDRLNKSILRYYFYAGQPSVELHWTFVVTADTDKVQFRDIGFQLTGSGATRVGLDAGQERALTDGYLLQKKADLYVVRRKDGAAYVESDRGQRAPGWIANDRFALAMRHFSGMFPKELEARGSVAILHAWPGHGEYNEDWFIEPKAPPDPNIPHEEIKGQNGIAVYPRYIQNGEPWHHGPLLDFRYPDWWRNPNMAGTREKASWLDPYTAVGNRAWESWVLYAKEIALGPVKFHAACTSRTQELLLDFGQQAAARALFLQSPHVWLKDTQWLDDARVLGPVNIHVAKSWLEGTKQGWERVEKSQHLGLWLYGNMPEYWYRDGTAGIYRMTAGIGHYGAIADWWLYMCSSDPVHLDYACAQARQYRDVHVVHYTSPDFLSLPVESRKVIGATTLMSPYPWFQGSDGWSMVRQFVYDYYLTGDRRSLEVLRYHALPTVRLARGALDRGCGAQLRTILDWYAHTWDPEAGEKIEEIIAWITSSDPKAESARKAPTPLNWTNCMPEYLELARDPSLPLRHREAMLTFVKGWVEEPAKGDTISCTGHVPDPGNLLACAWFHTGDPKYAMPFVRHIRKQKLPQEKWLEPAPGGGSSSAGNFDSLMYSYAAWRDAVEKGIVARLLEQGE
jgi:hypothetical protein